MIGIPERSIVLLIGPSGSGKTTFALVNFPRPAVLSSDKFRKMVSDSEEDQSVTEAAFDLLHKVAEARMQNGKLVVVDATNLKQEDRTIYRRLAKAYDYALVYIVFDYPEEVALWRNTQRARQVSDLTIARHYARLRQTTRGFAQEKPTFLHTLSNPKDDKRVYLINSTTLHYEDEGPFDIIGDVHGCYDELVELMGNLGYYDQKPKTRKLVFVGDLIDRGPKPVEVLNEVCSRVSNGSAYLVMGNHDNKLYRKLKGAQVQLNNGLMGTWDQVEKVEDYWKDFYRDTLGVTPPHLVLDRGKLVVTHAGIREWMVGKLGKVVESFCLYGDVDGIDPQTGLPIRRDWTIDWQGAPVVVYGHQPQLSGEVYINNDTFNIDTACVFGGKLTALRYPEMEIVQVPAHRRYAERG